MKSIKPFLIILGIGLMLTSCFQEVDIDKISGEYSDDFGLAIPAVRSLFTMKDVVVELNDSTEFYSDTANRQLMRFVHVEDPLIDIDVIDMLDIGVGEFSGSVKISDIDIPEFLSFKDSVTVVDIVDNINNPIVKLVFESALLGPTAVPSVTGLPIGTYSIWDSEGIKAIYFDKGIFEIEVENRMPIEVSFLATFKDKTGDFIAEQQIDRLKAGEMISFGVDAAGMDLDFPITVTIAQFGANADGLVQFKETDGLYVSANLKQVVFNKAELKIDDEIQGVGNDTITYNDKNKVLTYLKFASGVLNYKITNMSDIGQVDLHLKLPEFIVANGSMIEIDETLEGNVPSIGAIDLADALLELENSNLKQGKTLLQIITDVTVKPTSDTIVINYTDSIYGEFTLADVKLNAAKGWFGKDSVDIVEEMTELWLGFFEEDLSNVTMTNPSILFTVSNSFGISSDVDLTFKGVSEDETEEAIAVLNTISIQKPNAIGESSFSTVILDRDSTEGLVDLVNLPPAKVIHSGKIVVNPDYDPTDDGTIVENYFDETSRLSLGMRFELPFEFIADSFVYEDTLEYTWPEDTEDLYPRILMITTVHNLPFYILSEFVFLDASGMPTDTVVGSLIDPAPYDEDGFSTDSVKSKHEIILSDSQSRHLKTTESIRMRTTIYTGTKDEPKEIILQSTDYADIQIGVKGIFDVDNDL